MSELIVCKHSRIVDALRQEPVVTEVCVVGAIKEYIKHSTHINCLTRSHSECWCVKEFWKVKNSTNRSAIFEYWLANRIFGVEVFGEVKE